MWIRCFGFVIVVSLGWGSTVWAADKPNSSPENSQPIVLSTAGDSWADMGELQKAANAGKPAAMSAFGQMLLTGDGIAQDVPKALEMLDRASDAGQSSAAFRLGKVYEEGALVPADPAKAVAYYRRAALAGVAEAQYNLGAMYVSARGVPRDYKEGLAWIIEATKHGADADGEKRVRDRLTSTHRADLIPAAELRASELDLEITQATHATATAQPAQPAKSARRTDLPVPILNK